MKVCRDRGSPQLGFLGVPAMFLAAPLPWAVASGRLLSLAALQNAFLHVSGFFFFFFPKFLRVDQDKDKDCSLDCGGSSQKPLCASDGRTFLSRCEFQRAKCKDPQLEIAYRGNCRGKLV